MLIPLCGRSVSHGERRRSGRRRSFAHAQDAKADGITDDELRCAGRWRVRAETHVVKEDKFQHQGIAPEFSAQRAPASTPPPLFPLPPNTLLAAPRLWNFVAFTQWV